MTIRAALGATQRRSVQLLSTALLVAAPLSSAMAQQLTTVDGDVAVPMIGPRVSASLPVGPSQRAAHALRDDVAPLQRPAPRLDRADGWKLGGLTAAALLVSTADRRGDAWARRESVRNSDVLRQLAYVGDVTGTWVSAGIGPAAWLLGRVRGDSGAAMLG
ncbi:MAG TPA: hypothetical protein VE861_01750, partial [Gemmatimonadaceae bacterium]|nr:hypothetical protein [Gemmatimonadaceae bacterium]